MKISKFYKKSNDKFQPDDSWTEFSISQNELTLIKELSKAKMSEVAFFAFEAEDLSLESCARDDGSWDEVFSLGDGINVRIAPKGGSDGHLCAMIFDKNKDDIEFIKIDEFRKFYILAVSNIEIVSKESVLANVAYAAAALRGVASVEIHDDRD